MQCMTTILPYSISELSIETYHMYASINYNILMMDHITWVFVVPLHFQVTALKALYMYGLC